MSMVRKIAAFVLIVVISIGLYRFFTLTQKQKAIFLVKDLAKKSATDPEPLYWQGFIISLAVITFFLILGVYYFRKTEKTFADNI